MSKKTPDGLRTDATLTVVADPPPLRGQRRRCWLGYHHLGTTHSQKVHPRTADSGCAAAVPPAGKVRCGILRKPVKAFSESSAGKPASGGVILLGTRMWPSFASNWKQQDCRKGFSILLQGR